MGLEQHGTVNDNY